MAPSVAEVAVANARHVASAKAAHVTPAKAADVASAKATDVASAATTVSAATATAAGLCTRGNKAAGKQCACQDHHYSSSHDISPLEWAGLSASGPCQTPTCPSQETAGVAMD
jgi:hypothetical protein